MDVLDSVRDLRSDISGPTDAETAAAREKLDRAIASEAREPRPARRRRGVAWAGVLTGAAVIAAVALVVASVGGIGSVSKPGHHAQIGVAVPPANAAEVLTRAAKLADRSVPAQPAPGQYLRVETDTARLQTSGPGTYGQFRRGSTASWIEHTVSVVYVPADRSGTWVEEDNAAPVTVSDKHGTDVDAAIAAEQASNAQLYSPTVQYFKAGREPSNSASGQVSQLGSPAWADVAPSAVPTDPAQLIAFYRAQLAPNGYGDSTDPELIAAQNKDVFQAMAGNLQSNLMPAAQRAAVFRALAQVPGVTLLSTSGTSSTLRLLGRHSDERLTIDTATGLVTGVTTFLNETEGATQTIGVVPAGTPTFTTTVTTTVVDTLPASLQAGLRGGR